jgi:hypothetical protein
MDAPLGDGSLVETVCGLAPVPLPLMFAISIAARMLDRVLRERSDRW